jgi:hypothetical protein
MAGAEVDEHGPPVQQPDQHVVALHVPVHGTGGMNGFQSACQLGQKQADLTV